VGVAGEAVSSSFDEFFAVGYPRLVRSLTALTGRRAVAEEIAQEAMFEAYRRWRTVSELDRPDLWVRRVAMNRSISLHRRVVSEAAALARVATWRASEVVVELSDPELWVAVRRLPARQRSALVLSVEGYSAREIGEILGCAEETAQTHVRRGRARLAELLNEEVSA
jgi:RNA polymerase sigma-70 factor (ECF subfamily)